MRVGHFGGNEGRLPDVLADFGFGEAAEGGELAEREIVLGAEFLGEHETLVGVEPSGAVFVEKMNSTLPR